MTTLALVRDLLDKRLQDRNGRFSGTVDSILLELRDDGPPTVQAIEIGAPVILRRVHPALVRWAHRLPITRVPLSALREVGADVELDLDAEHHPQLLRVEKWFRRRIIERIPGNGR